MWKGQSNFFSEAWDLTPVETRQLVESKLLNDVQSKIDSLAPRELSHAEAVVLVKTIGIARAGRFASKLYPTTKLRLDSKLNQIMKNSKGIILKWATFPSAVKTEYFSTPVLSLPLPTLESLKKQCRGTGENPSHNCCEEFLASL